jgi:hypothetical protein
LAVEAGVGKKPNTAFPKNGQRPQEHEDEDK